MSKKYEIIDGIRSSDSGPIEFQSIGTYKLIYTADDFAEDDQINKRATEELINDAIASISIIPIIYPLPAGSETPVIIDFTADTIKIGTAAAVAIGADLSNYQANPQILFEVIVDSTNSAPKTAGTWIDNKEWADNTYSSLVAVTLQPDTDTGFPGGLTRDNLNIIIKP